MDKRKRWDEIQKGLSELDKTYTKVGLPEGGKVEAPTQTGSKERTVTDIIYLVQIGAWNEFGNSKIPERSFLRSTTDEQRVNLERLKEKVYTDILYGIRTPKEALSVVGEFLTGKVKRKIQTLKVPQNAPSTIKNKGSSNPLIDTGQMVQSIQHVEVVE